MRIYKVTREAIFEAARDICRVEVEYLNPSRGGGQTFSVKAYPLTDVHPNLYRRYSVTGMVYGPDRRINALCWHGFEAFFKRLFDLCPDAVAVTAMARYEGRDGFYATYPKTAWKNVGSEMYPIYAVEACTCSHWTERAEKDEKKLGPVKYPKV